MTIGNAAGVEISLNGQSVGPLGEVGEVVRIRLPRPGPKRSVPSPIHERGAPEDAGALPEPGE